MNKKAKGAIVTVAGLSAVLGSLFLTKKIKAFLKEGRCIECGKKIGNEFFTLYEPKDMAYLSREVVDSKFTIKGDVCPDCYDSIYAPNIKSYERALEVAESVKVYFKDFQGEVNYSEEIKKISTECFDNKEEALYSLKTMAAYLECNLVFDVEFSTEVINNDRIKRVMYKVKGIIARS
ncbi:MAG: hypothetical protein RR645_01500 [Clostridium sp.]